MNRPRVSLKTRSMGDEIAYLIDKALGQTNVPEIMALRLRLETAFEIRIRDSRARVAELEAALIEAEGALRQINSYASIRSRLMERGETARLDAALSRLESLRQEKK